MKKLSVEETCPACGGVGWLEVSVDGNEPPPTMVFIQKCDECDKFSSDTEAALVYPGASLAVLCRKQLIAGQNR